MVRLIGMGLVLLIAVVGTFFESTGEDNNSSNNETPAAIDDPFSQPGKEPTSAGQFSDLPSVSSDQLPPEAIDTLDDISAGGPYQFGKDDTVFQNREGILPSKGGGHYREYTVVTPGESDRGARRIVAGDDGELYYTSDHYSSFSEIDRR